MFTEQFHGDQRLFNQRIIQTLEEMGAVYAIGGSVASMSYSNEARFTIDIDMMLADDLNLLQHFVEEVESWNIYIAPFETIIEFDLPNELPFNITDGMLGTKDDLYVIWSSEYGKLALSRRVRRRLYTSPDFFAWFLSPEDVILYKLVYYLKSEGSLTKHPIDIHKMLMVISEKLDLLYMDLWAQKLDVKQIWDAIWSEFHLDVTHP